VLASVRPIDETSAKEWKQDRHAQFTVTLSNTTIWQYFSYSICCLFWEWCSPAHDIVHAREIISDGDVADLKNHFDKGRYLQDGVSAGLGRLERVALTSHNVEILYFEMALKEAIKSGVGSTKIPSPRYVASCITLSVYAWLMGRTPREYSVYVVEGPSFSFSFRRPLSKAEHCRMFAMTFRWVIWTPF
jgi:hypothetical protein